MLRETEISFLNYLKEVTKVSIEDVSYYNRLANEASAETDINNLFLDLIDRGILKSDIVYGQGNYNEYTVDKEKLNQFLSQLEKTI